jgi:Bacterial virulence protein (VirJ)
VSAGLPFAALLTAVLSVSCTRLGKIETEPAVDARVFQARLTLEGKPFDLHVASPSRPIAPDVLVLYASGDGGWFGSAVDMFQQIVGDGYYAVGFSSRTFLNVQRPAGEATTVDRLVDDYQRIIVQARLTLALPASTRTVLTGWSRGAAFAVLVASDVRARPDLLGVVAIGLDEGEDLKNSAEPEAAADDGPRTVIRHRSPFDTYGRIGAIAPFPCAVIQATHDNYLPAADARRLFGVDSETRRFFSVDARNHRFSGGQSQFDRSLRLALAWVVSQGRVEVSL